MQNVVRILFRGYAKEYNNDLRVREDQKVENPCIRSFSWNKFEFLQISIFVFVEIKSTRFFQS